MDRNRWLIFAGLCIALIVAMVMFTSKDKVDVSSVDGTKIDTTSAIPDHVSGLATSKIILIEYADFQCPGCYASYPKIKTITEQYKDHVAVVYRNFPLISGHQHAFAAAATAEAAGLQGKYWEMHDLVFQSQSDWKSLTPEQRNSTFEGYATSLGLNLEQFRTDLASDKVAAKINTDRSLGIKMGVDSTPTFYLNGNKVATDVTTNIMSENGDKLRDLLDEQIKAGGGTPPARVTTTATTAQ